eukprot:CAMPEP_0182433486 /NCGR_PEP_ID=MMETSP1167-20130531/63534_1 /TAXON_ID=2988 /ORGANISM="Mallomonas Sp, Strain CCMP3275" /LENGTH=226 /DNA_ID=CAMNT_0024622225 /DNA_START=927 /DNA_END=1607 /DNA_ORIENTATION=-
MIVWLITLLFTVAIWIAFSAYIYVWVVDSSSDVVFAWGVTLIITWVLQTLFIEILSIYFWYVLPVQLMRKKLRRLHDVIASESALPSSGRQTTWRSMIDQGGDQVISPTAIVASRVEGESMAREASALILGLDPSIKSRLSEGTSIELAPLDGWSTSASPLDIWATASPLVPDSNQYSQYISDTPEGPESFKSENQLVRPQSPPPTVDLKDLRQSQQSPQVPPSLI